MLERYLDVLAATGKSGQTIRTYRIQLTKFQTWLQSNGFADDLSQVTTIDVSEYRDSLQESGKKPATVNTALASIEAFCNWMVSEGRMDTNPAVKVRRVSQVQEPPKWLSRSERSRLLRAVEKQENLRNIAVVHVLLQAGLRASELCALTHDDVLISERKGSIVVQKGKGNKMRVVPIPRETRYWLGAYIADEHPVGKWLFPSQRGDQLTYQGLYKLCTALGDAADIEGLTPHVLRHTFGHELATKKVAIQDIAILMGHERLENTMIYIRSGREELQAAVDKLSYT